MEFAFPAECREVNSQNTSIRCEWVQQTTSCNDHDAYLDYIYFMYCGLGPDGTPGAVCVTVMWLLVLFLALGVTADDFLCPALVVISKTLRLSQNIAGVTFLAFGNGAPDIFSSLAGIQQARSDLVIGELFGAGMFVTTVVAGTICMSQPFKIMERPFLRDIIFYIFATFWAFCLFYSHQIRLKYAAGFIALYGVYIFVVIVGRIVFQRNKTPEAASAEVTGSPLSTSMDSNTSGSSETTLTSTTSVSSAENIVVPTPAITIMRASGQVIPGQFNSAPASMEITITPPDCDTRRLSMDHNSKTLFNGSKVLDDPEAEGVVLRRFSFRKSLAMPRRRTLSSHSREESTKRRARGIDNPIHIVSDNNNLQVNKDPSKVTRPPFLQQWSTTSMMSLISKGDNDRITPWKDFIFELCPIDISGWGERRWYSKIVEILKAPVYFLLAITTPVVDYEADHHNWCKYLNVLHCITGPMFVVFCSKSFDLAIGGSFPLWALVLIISFMLATFVFFTSIVDDPPPYHAVYAYLGFGVSVMWIYALAHEIVSLLKAIGIVFDMSDTILGLTVLAWGNSIGDFISNTSVARQGFPRMGISACFGGPLLNLLLGIGIPYTVSLVQTGSPLELEYTKLVTVLYAALAISLVSTLVTMTILQFNVKKFYGIYLVVLYGCFLVVAVLVETGVL